MYKVAWGVKEKPIRGKAIEETENSWTLPIIHAAKEGEEEDYVVDITPRNLQKMKVKAGQKFTKVHIRDKILRRLQAEATGEITADKYNLLLIPKVPIRRSGCLVVVRRKGATP